MTETQSPDPFKDLVPHRAHFLDGFILIPFDFDLNAVNKRDDDKSVIVRQYQEDLANRTTGSVVLVWRWLDGSTGHFPDDVSEPVRRFLSQPYEIVKESCKATIRATF